MEYTGTLIAIDSGSSQSGVVVVKGLKIAYAANIPNAEVLKLVKATKKEDGGLVVLVEDIKPYSVSLTQSTIDTCKFIGRVCFFMEAGRVKYELITRHQVKKWVYDQFPTIVLERVCKKIAYKNKRNNDGKLRKPSYVYVDDRIVIAAMKDLWKIPTPKPGKKNILGLSDHSWQALGVMSYFLYGRHSHQLPT